jgi:hypothetical protein
VPSTTAALTYRSLLAIREFRVLSGLWMFGGPLVSLVVSQLLLVNGMMLWQAIGALIAGAVALLLVPGLRRSAYYET